MATINNYQQIPIRLQTSTKVSHSYESALPTFLIPHKDLPNNLQRDVRIVSVQRHRGNQNTETSYLVLAPRRLALGKSNINFKLAFH